CTLSSRRRFSKRRWPGGSSRRRSIRPRCRWSSRSRAPLPVSRIDAPASRTDPAGRRTAFENAFPARILVSRQVDGNVGRVIDFLRRVGGGGGVEREIGAIVNRLMARAFWG